jgi:hypothetical protein
MPTQICLIFLKTEIGSSLIYLGIVSLIGGFLMSLIWCCQYALWKTYDDDEEAK